MNLIHRLGKSWIVGPEHKLTSPVPVNPPIVLLLQFREHSWGSLGKADRTEKFCKAFEHEAEQHYVQLVPVLAEKGSFYHGYSVAEGREQVRKLIRSIERQYLGTLIVGTRTEIPDLAAWVRDLSLFRRPVVWFDRNDENCKDILDRKYFTRCHFAEKPAETVILDLLAGTGHRTIGYTALYDDSWIHARFERLASLGAALPQPVRVVNSGTLSGKIEEVTDDFLVCLLRSIDKPSLPIHNVFEIVNATFPHAPSELQEYDIQSKWGDRYERYICLLRLLVRLYREGRDDLLKRKYGLPEYENGIVFQCPLFANLLRANKITALIAPNDAIARYVYVAVQALGYNIPHDISIVSFDN